MRVMGILDTLRAGLVNPRTENRAGLVSLVETLGRDPVEQIGADYVSFVQRGYQDNGIIYAAITARLHLFAQGRLHLRNKRDGDERDLPPRINGIVSKPWPNGSQSEMLARIEQDTSLGGNWYLYAAERARWQRLRPDWVDIILDPAGRELVGYLYHEGGRNVRNPKVLLPDEVAHGSPIPDPLAAFRGMSWITSVVREVMGDTAMNRHKLKFFENAATPNLLIRFMATLSDPARTRLEEALKAKHAGIGNAYKSLILEEGGDATVVGSTLQQVAFDTVQAAGENRIAVAAGVPSVVLGIKEGAEQATYNNYGQALQHFANFAIQHLWTHTAGALETLIPVPDGWELAFDDSQIPALQSDRKEDAEILEIQATTIRELTDAGYTPESSVEAVTQNDLSLLEHTGVLSDDLQEQPGGTPDPQALPAGDDQPDNLAFLNA